MDVVTFSEGNRLLRVSRSTAYRLIADPHSDFIRPFRMRGRLYYLRADIEAWLLEKAAAAQLPPTAIATAALRRVA